MIAFIDDHRGAHGVEPICKVLPIAPSTCQAHVAKRRDPARLSARARQDAALKIEVRRVFDENFSVYGVRKVWWQLKRKGFDVARCTVSRLMQDMGLQRDGAKSSLTLSIFSGETPAAWRQAARVADGWREASCTP